MSRYIVNNPKKVGSAPGTLVHIGSRFKENSEITFIKYDKETEETFHTNDIDKCFSYIDNKKINWLNIEGLQDVSIIERIGKEFNLHPLLLEDILNTGQRAKIDDYDDCIFIVLKVLTYNKNLKKIKSEQVSFVFVNNCIISFQERDIGVFDNVKNRIKVSNGNIRKLGADYLLYGLIDAVVDSYFVILENFGNKIDSVEDALINNPQKGILKSIHNLKREMLFLRNSIWPLREVVSILVRGDNSRFSENTIVYLRDVYDHIIQIIDTVEVYRDMLSGMLDTYLSSISNKTNDVMKVLTIISTIFIPITFLAGVYGMNFKYIPELEMPYGYGLFWVIVIIITLLMIRYFKKKTWI
ncbi:magnesium/cobalt transporter CorA [Clostridium sp. P21]|uniref:Magnesium transport protein CorA n=1 Tax=Clostridium muellerianum TaxID=2716538 RepID=A0A7Y0EGR7_9CLOT|nr:magnesium/cobalt transporter CorA [Clostridium muellerianum]NMM63155.1 magnesium/cobalt transporter CorA [Clostridium muellerianum]